MNLICTRKPNVFIIYCHKCRYCQKNRQTCYPLLLQNFNNIFRYLMQIKWVNVWCNVPHTNYSNKKITKNLRDSNKFIEGFEFLSPKAIPLSNVIINKVTNTCARNGRYITHKTRCNMFSFKTLVHLKLLKYSYDRYKIHIWTAPPNALRHVVLCISGNGTAFSTDEKHLPQQMSKQLKTLFKNNQVLCGQSRSISYL